MTPRQKLENQCRFMIVAGIPGSLLAYLAFLGLSQPWNLIVAWPLLIVSLMTATGGLWRWHLYQRNRPSTMIVTDGTACSVCGFESGHYPDCECLGPIEPTEYKPDYAVPPGETIKELLDERGMSRLSLAERMRCPTSVVEEIVRGERAISAENADGLSRVFAVPASFWLNLEKNYRLALVRLGKADDILKE